MKNYKFKLINRLNKIQKKCEDVASSEDISLEDKSEFLLKNLRDVNGLSREIEILSNKLGALVRPINQAKNSDS